MTVSNAAEIQLEILRKFPLLVPKDDNFSSYEGFLEAGGSSFHISFYVPHYPYATEMSINCDWELSELLQKQKSTVVKWISSGILLNQFLDKLNNMINDCIDQGEDSHLALNLDGASKVEQCDNLNHYTSILSELSELGTNNLVSMSNDFKNVSLSSCDCNGEDHVLNIKFTCDETHAVIIRNSFEIVDTDLPEAIIKIIQKENNISRAFRVFCDQIKILSNVWRSLALFDKQCWVIDPIHPRKSDMYRRIFISPPSVMAQLSWDPMKPNQPPVMRFQGADAEIDKLRCLQEKHLEDWDEECSILDNICAVLQLSSLPQPPPPDTNTVSQTVETGECSICYTVEDDEGILPEESCGKCFSNFHAACLYEWLEGLPGSRLVHGHVSGPCPNCETAMKCPCPHT